MPMIVQPARFAVAGGGGLSFPLDAIQSSFQAAYAPFRRLFTDYEGPLCKVRNGSAVATDFYAGGDGWLDLDAVITHIGGIGGACAMETIYDQSGNGYDTPASPDFVLLGRDAVANLYTHGDSNQSRTLSASIFSGLTSGAYYGLMKQVTESAPFHVSNYVEQSHMPFGDGNAYDGFLANSRPNLGSYGYDTTAFRLRMVTNTGSALRAWKDGEVKGTSQAATFNASPGYRRMPAPASGQHKEWGIFNAVLADADRELLEGNVLWWWGLQAQLPSGHPYQSSAPT